MKIKTEDETFIIPDSDKPLLIEFNGYKDAVIDCLSSIFVQKKKNKCRVFDDNGEEIRFGEANFIYVPSDISIDNNMNLRSKSILNSSLAEFIQDNPDDFLSIETIRDGLKGITTDKGMYKILKIMTNGLNTSLSVEFDHLNIPSLLESLVFENHGLSKTEKMMFIYNLLIYLSRNNYNIIMIDIEISEMVEHWISSINNNNCTILIDNGECSNICNSTYNLVSLSNIDFCEDIEISKENVSLYSYLLHPLIRHNKDLQTEKNQEKITRINDRNTTFFLKTE
ncbi:MAG: hypothetical protein ACI4WM_07125 [Erysipelotrichaceae bacterium]